MGGISECRIICILQTWQKLVPLYEAQRVEMDMYLKGLPAIALLKTRRAMIWFHCIGISMRRRLTTITPQIHLRILCYARTRIRDLKASNVMYMRKDTVREDGYWRLKKRSCNWCNIPCFVLFALLNAACQNAKENYANHVILSFLFFLCHFICQIFKLIFEHFII